MFLTDRHFPSPTAARRLLMAPLLLALAGSCGAPSALAAGDDAFAAALPNHQSFDPASDAIRAAAVLHHLPADEALLRLQGEVAARTLPFAVTAHEALRGGRFQLSFLNAVSVMPEASALRVFVNDVAVGTTTIDAGTETRTAVFDVPGGILRPGTNAVRIEASQRHRVDCSLAATYELWTQVDPARTGFLFAPDALSYGRLEDLMAVPLDAGGVARIRAVLPAGADAASVNRVMRAVQDIAVAGNFQRPDVEIAQTPGTGPGIDVVVATRQTIAADPALRAAIGSEQPPIAVLNGNGKGRAMLVLSGRSAEELNQVITEFARTARRAAATGTEPGRLARIALQGVPVTENSRIALRDLGVRAEEFDGRLYRTAFDIRMPADFYPADYGKAALYLAAGYVGGLKIDNQVTVRINDRVAAGLPLTNQEGEVFKGRRIALPLKAFRPGFNHIDIEVRLAAKADETCDPLAALNGKTRFVMFAESELEIPRLARMAQMPNLSGTAGNGFPYSTSATRLYVPYPDATSVGAAGTLLARLAVAAGKALPVAMMLSAPPRDAGSALIVGAFPDLNPAVVSSTGLEVNALRTAWATKGQGYQTASLSGIAADPITTGSIATHGAATPELGWIQPSPRQSGPSYDDWSRRVSETNRTRGLLTSVGSWLHDGLGLDMDEMGLPISHSATVPINPSTALVVGQAEAPSVPGATWTVVTAPSVTALKAGVDALVAPSMWNALKDRAATFDETSGAITTVAPGESYYVIAQPWSLGNMRRIIAGWFSLNIGYYVLALVGLTLFVGALGHPLIRRAGQKES